MKARLLLVITALPILAAAQTSALAPVPRQQPLNNSGLIMGGGCIYTYSSGTSTPQATYSDSTLSAPNTNPIVLDSSGRAPAIYWNGTAIKLTLGQKSLGSCPASPGTVVWSQDPIFDTGLALKAALAATSATAANNGAALSGFEFPSSSTAQTVQSRLDQSIFTSDFGACTNSSDTSRLQAAINAAISLSFELVANCNSTITAVSILTTGRFSMRMYPGKTWTCGTVDCVTAVSLSGGNPVYDIDGLKLTGNGLTTSGNGLVIRGTAIPILHFRNIDISGFKGTGCTVAGEANGCAAMYLNGPEDSDFTGVFLHNSYIGLRADGAFNANAIVNGAFNLNDAYGVYAYTSYDVSCVACVVQSNVRQGFFGTGTRWNWIAPHFENNNTSAASGLCTFTIDSTAASGASSFGAAQGGGMAGDHEKICFTNTGGNNAFNQIIGGSYSSLLGGVDVTSAPHQIFNASVAPSAVTGADTFTQFLPTSEFQYLAAANGDCSAPTYSFVTAATMGMTYLGGNVAFCHDGVQKGYWSGSLFNFLQPIYATEVHPVNGFSGTKTAGSCTFTLADGIVTNVTGC